MPVPSKAAEFVVRLSAGAVPPVQLAAVENVVSLVEDHVSAVWAEVEATMSANTAREARVRRENRGDDAQRQGGIGLGATSTFGTTGRNLNHGRA